MRMTTTAIMVATITSFGSVAAAQGVSGYIGVTGGYNEVKEADGNGPDESNSDFYTVEGALEYGISGGFTLGVDAFFRADDLNGNFTATEDPLSEYTVTLHALYDLSDGTRAGVFLGYGQQTPQDLDMADAYDVMFYGLEIQTRLADNVEVYAQIGAGGKVADGQDSDEGWNGGIIGHFGLNYDMTSNTMLNFDFEISTSRNYIDSSDPGRFFGVTIGGKTKIMEDTPLYANYFARYDYFSSTDEGDGIDEVQFGVGLQYEFGGGSNLISSPRLPTRASAWTEWMD